MIFHSLIHFRILHTCQKERITGSVQCYTPKHSNNSKSFKPLQKNKMLYYGRRYAIWTICKCTDIISLVSSSYNKIKYHVVCFFNLPLSFLHFHEEKQRMLLFVTQADLGFVLKTKYFRDSFYRHLQYTRRY